MQIFCAKKLEKKKGVHMIKDLISESAIELFREIYEEHEFDEGLSTIKMLKTINAGTKFVSTSKEEGRSLLENTTNEAIEFDESMIDNTSSNLINDNCIDCVDTNKNETCSDSDSSCCSKNEAVVEK